MTGTLINVAAVVIGGALGTFLGARLPEKMRDTVLGALGLVVFLIGISMALTGNTLIVLASLLLGAILGEWLQLDERLNTFGRLLEERFARNSGGSSFSKGFVTASLVFCVGPMAILGAIQDGLVGDFRLLAVKSMLDGFAGLAFSASLGIGVAFSAFPILLYQGAIAIAAMTLGSLLGTVSRDTPWVVQLTATGGTIIMGIGLLLLDLKRLRIANFLPALVIAPLIVLILQYLHLQLP